MRKLFATAVLATGLMAGTAGAIEWVGGVSGVGSSPGSALNFNGGSGPGTFVNIPALDMNGMVQGGSDYTMSLWVSPDLIPGESFFLGQTDQGIHHGLRDSGKLHSAHWGNDFSAATTVPTGDGTDASHWVHALYTYDNANTTGTVYFNGASDGVKTDQGAPNGGGNFVIGTRNGTGGPAFDGQIDDVAIWDRVLPQAEITSLTGGAVPSSIASGLVSYWNFEEGSGLVVGDSTGTYPGDIPPPPPPIDGPFPLAPGNWNTRVIGLSDNGSDTEVNDHTEARGIIGFANGGDNPNGWDIAVDMSDNRDRVDMAGGGGSFTHDHVYPDASTAPNGGEDFVVHATTKNRFRFPEGEYTIAFGSDDGGQVQLEGVNFIEEFNTDGDADPNDDTAFFNGNRGHGWTGGTFTVGPEGLEAHVDASMHERGGGDSFEVAITDSHQTSFTGNGFFLTLAGEGEFGVSVVPEPSSTLLLGMGLGLLGLLRRKRK